MQKEFCQICGYEFDEVPEVCPNCQSKIYLCANSSCKKVISSQNKFCPFCGTKNVFIEDSAEIDLSKPSVVPDGNSDGFSSSGDDAFDFSFLDNPDVKMEDTIENIKLETPITAVSEDLPDLQVGDNEFDFSFLEDLSIPETSDMVSQIEESEIFNMVRQVPEKSVSLEDSFLDQDSPLATIEAGLNSEDFSIDQLGAIEQTALRDLSSEMSGLTNREIITTFQEPAEMPICSIGYDGSQQYKVNKKGLIQILIDTTAASVSNNSFVIELEASPDLGITTQIPESGFHVHGGEKRQFTVSCYPKAAGKELVTVLVKKISEFEVIQDILSGVFSIAVEGEDARNITIEARDIIDFGVSKNNSLQQLLNPKTTGLSSAGNTESWISVDLRSTLAKYTKPIHHVTSLLSEGHKQDGIPCIRFANSLLVSFLYGTSFCIVILGKEIKLGGIRENKSIVINETEETIQFYADSGSENETKRISRSHIECMIEDDRLYIHDVSANGTLLNNVPIDKNHWFPLQGKDQMSMRGYVNFRVAITATDMGVSYRFDRIDRDNRRKDYLFIGENRVVIPLQILDRNSSEVICFDRSDNEVRLQSSRAITQKGAFVCVDDIMISNTTFREE
jgi:RNA polymerase subunit RPABC4/transcription elongation factor Spt4